MTFPHRLKFVLLLMCCMQHALASNSSTHDPTNSPSAYVKNTSTPVTTSSSSTMAVVNNTVSKNGTSTTRTPMTASTKASAIATVEPTSTTYDTTKSSSASAKITSTSVTKSSSISTISKASAKAVVNNTASKDRTSTTSTTHDTTKSSSADVKTTSPSVTTSSSMSTIRNAVYTLNCTRRPSLENRRPQSLTGFVLTAMTVTFSIGTEYSSLDCASCSIGGTITVTMSCSIKMPPNDDKECDKDEFNKTSCGYVTLANKVYRCAEVEKNFTYHEKEHLKPVKQCDDVCPASGSVLSANLVFIFSSGLAVGLLSRTL